MNTRINAIIKNIALIDGITNVSKPIVIMKIDKQYASNANTFFIAFSFEIFLHVFLYISTSKNSWKNDDKTTHST